MWRRTRTLVLSFAVVGVAAVSTVGTQAACSSSKTCTASESQACDNTFTNCTNAAAAAADKVACNKCVDDDCSCYTNCGSSCDRTRLAAACAGIP